MASSHLLKTSPYSSSDTENSDADSAMLASCSLQEIRQEDLAAILPDQQEIDDFDFKDNKSEKSPITGDVSDSDMELPQQAVNALIQRTTENCSEEESQAPVTLYSNSLLQQFVVQTQLINTSSVQITPKCDVTEANSQVTSHQEGKMPEVKKRGRGRPKKSEFRNNPNVSPDSGIQNSPEHVSSSPEPVLIKKRVDRRINKTKIPMDRILYPPRNRVGRPPLVKKGPGRPPKHRMFAKPQQKLITNNLKGRVIQIPKLMHSKSKHKLHKKYKFRVVKKVTTQDPDFSVEISNLVADFAKFCAIDTKKEYLISKKVAKKRKTTDFKNKNNEQRLPLKKRHYHMANNNVEKENDKEEDGNKIKEKMKDGKKVDEESNKIEKKANHKKQNNLVLNNIIVLDHKKVLEGEQERTNNNNYDIKEKREVKNTIDEAIEACINRYSKENNEKHDKKTSSIAITPKKRHRIELIEKEIKEEITKINEENHREREKPKVTIESFITELKEKRSLIKRKLDIGENIRKAVKEMKKEKVEDIQKKQAEELAKKKVRKRRSYNRTGFPTIKRKKKKSLYDGSQVLPRYFTDSSCDRVPKEGEEVTKFLQRTVKENSLEKSSENSLKFDEPMSDCESLPEDERVDFDEDNLLDRYRRDYSPSISSSTTPENDLELSLESSIERLRSRLDKNVNRTRNKISRYPKRKPREFSLTDKGDRASTSGDEKRSARNSNVKLKKKYLVAGLFSDYYKEDDEMIRQRRSEISVKISRNFTYNKLDHRYGLLPPPYHCGKYLRCRKIHFQLPNDIWWLHEHSQLNGRESVPSWNYKKIRTNIYNTKTTGVYEPQTCNCKQSSNCGDDCINRLVFSECPPSHRCQNQRIQRHEWAPGIERFMTESKGWGVRTKLNIKSGEFILEYVGEVVNDQEFKERMGGIYANDNHHYCLHLDGGLVIDGHRMGSNGRFVNHSCNPNCEMQKWSVNGHFRMALFSLRDIQAGEELTYDYNFSLFNPAEGQECKCGSTDCRGVIGGKSQRVRQLPEVSSTENRKISGRVGRPRKTEAKKKANGGKETEKPQPSAVLSAIQMKPISHQQKCFVLERHCFLIRNLTKVRKVCERSVSVSYSRPQTSTPSGFINHLNALQKPRNIKTRKLTQAEDDPEFNKNIKLASLLKEIWTAVVTAKDVHGVLISTPFINAPSKRKFPEFYINILNPIDLTTIEQNIANGFYKTPESFDEDFLRLFKNYTKFYGRSSEIGMSAVNLKKIYVNAKRDNSKKFEEALGEKVSTKFVSKRKNKDEEDIIRCVCGIPCDEGLMIQCEKCTVWQHCECVQADPSALSYTCEQCVPREVDYEIPLDEYTEHGHRYYLTLMRDDLQLRQGETVYVLRDIPIPGTDKKHTYDTIGTIEYSELDIFRIERLWKDKDTGRRMVYGHHYLRPHETFHEPTRRFFPNEVMRVPQYEAVPAELIISRCWVVDPNTYCKGRPLDAKQEHIYICEYRVDKAARMFSKISKNKFPICTKSFAFERFETRLKISRTYCPHDIDPSLLSKSNGRKPKVEVKKEKEKVKEKGCSRLMNGKNQRPTVILPRQVRTTAERKSRLNRILLNLLGKLPVKQVCDLSYLLETTRRRKKQQNNS